MTLKPKLTGLSSGLSAEDQATVRGNMSTDFFALRENQRYHPLGDLPRLQKAIADCMVSDGIHHVRVGVWGDSVGRDYIDDRAECLIFRELGFGGRWLQASSSNGTFYHSGLTSGVFNTANFDISPSGLSITLQAGGVWEAGFTVFFDNTLTLEQMTADKVTLCYAKESGAGVIKVETKPVGTRTWTEVESGIDASSVSADFGSVTFDLPPQPGSRFRVTQVSGGDVRLIGALVYDNTKSGVIIMPMTLGGINVGQVADNAITDVYDGLMSVLQPNVMLWSAKDTVEDLTASLDSYVSVMESGWPYFDWCFVIPTAEKGSLFDSIGEENESFVRNYALTNGHAVYDFREVVRTYEDSLRPLEPAKPITTLTRSGTTATATVTGHGYYDDQVVSITGSSDSNFDGEIVRIAVINGNSFSYNVANAGASSATGASVQKLAGIYHDTSHLSTPGGDVVASEVLRSIGLLGNSLTKMGRDVASQEIEAFSDIKHKGRSLADQDRRNLENTIFATRGLVTDSTQGILSRGDVVTNVGTGDMTLSMTVKANALENDWGVRIQEGTSTANTPFLYLGRGDPDIIKVNLRNSSNTQTAGRSYTGSGIDDLLGKLAHVVLVREGGVVAVYLNSELLIPPGGDDTGFPTTLADTVPTERFRVSAGSNTSQVEFLEAAFWSSALSASQITDYYHTMITPESPEVLWKFREGSGNWIADDSGNGRYGEAFYNPTNGREAEYTWVHARQNDAIRVGSRDGILRVNEVQVHEWTLGGSPEWELPPAPQLGDFVHLVSAGTSGWTITQPAGHQIVELAGDTVGTNATTAGVTGSLASTADYDCVRLRCIEADSVTPTYRWVVETKNGTLAWT